MPKQMPLSDNTMLMTNNSCHAIIMTTPAATSNDKGGTMTTPWLDLIQNISGTSTSADI